MNENMKSLLKPEFRNPTNKVGVYEGDLLYREEVHKRIYDKTRERMEIEQAVKELKEQKDLEELQPTPIHLETLIEVESNMKKRARKRTIREYQERKRQKIIDKAKTRCKVIAAALIVTFIANMTFSLAATMDYKEIITVKHAQIQNEKGLIKLKNKLNGMKLSDLFNK